MELNIREGSEPTAWLKTSGHPELFVDFLDEVLEDGRAGTMLGLHVGNNSQVSEASRDAALVLSGGGINGVLLELGFLNGRSRLGGADVLSLIKY